MRSIDDEWSNYLNGTYQSPGPIAKPAVNRDAPEPTEFAISTKSLEIFISESIDLNIFWSLPVITYGTRNCGIVQKIMRCETYSPAELAKTQDMFELTHRDLYTMQCIQTHIDNPNANIDRKEVQFKDVRKIAIGLSEKNILAFNKPDSCTEGFRHCFVLIMRVFIDAAFREFHVKVFNTGKIVIPGITEDRLFPHVLTDVMKTLCPFTGLTMESIKSKPDITLINSQFHCQYFIDKDVCSNMLKTRYGLLTEEDSERYQGVRGTFYYYNDISDDEQTGVYRQPDADTLAVKKTKKMRNKNPNIQIITFIIFRTGSVLMMGKCSVPALEVIYKYLTKLLRREFEFVGRGVNPQNVTKAPKITKPRKCIIQLRRVA